MSLPRSPSDSSAPSRSLGSYQEVGTDRSTFAVFSLWGKFGGLHACGATFPHMVPLPNIFLTLLFSNLRLKRKDFLEIVRLTWAQEASGSNPDAPTKNISRVFFRLMKAPFHSKLICGILADRSSQFASRLVSESSPHDEFAKTRGGRSAIQKLLNGRKLIARDLASMGKIRGTLRISRLIDLRKCKSGNYGLGSARDSPCLSSASSFVG